MKEIDNWLPTSVVTGIRIRVNLIMSICFCNCRSLDSRKSTLVDNVPFFMIWTHEILQNASLCCTLHQLKFYFNHNGFLLSFWVFICVIYIPGWKRYENSGVDCWATAWAKEVCSLSRTAWHGFARDGRAFQSPLEKHWRYSSKCERDWIKKGSLTPSNTTKSATLVQLIIFVKFLPICCCSCCTLDYNSHLLTWAGTPVLVKITYLEIARDSNSINSVTHFVRMFHLTSTHLYYELSNKYPGLNFIFKHSRKYRLIIQQSKILLGKS